MMTPTDGAVIVQGALEAVARFNSRPGVIPIPVKDVWLIGNPFEPLSPYSDHRTTDDTWIVRAGGQYLVKNQVFSAKPQTGGIGGGMASVIGADPLTGDPVIGGFPITPTQDAFIPGKN